MTSDYRASGLLTNRHVNTIFGARLTRRPSVAYRRERWDTPDGDFIDVDFVDGPVTAPLVVLLHGLEGSSASSYARSLMDRVRDQGWRGAVAHFRGCSGEPNRLPRAYHAGDSAEADFIFRRMALVAGDAPLYGVGVSLGGNVLCKWLGEQGDRAPLARAVAVCAPIDLRVAGDALLRGFGLVYGYHFVRTLRRGAAAMLARFPHLADAEKVRKARTLRTFDDVFTAPVHGFAGVDDYYTRASALPVLSQVRVPTLLINPLDDPFYPGEHFPDARHLSSAIHVDRPAHGGHVGFASLGGEDWLSRRVLRELDR